MLDLTRTGLTDQGVSHLCDALKDVNCKLTVLDLTRTGLTDHSLTHLCDALKDVNCKLTVLNLARNPLIHELFKLTTLDDIRENMITEGGAADMLCALKDVHLKLTLYLCVNIKTDQGLKHLGDSLKDENCEVTVINIIINVNVPFKGVLHQCDFATCNLRRIKCHDSNPCERIRCKYHVTGFDLVVYHNLRVMYTTPV